MAVILRAVNSIPISLASHMCDKEQSRRASDPTDLTTALANTGRGRWK
jgi:hypothetical protein